MAETGDSKGLIGKGIGFLGDSQAELKKVSTPSRQETLQATMVVMVMLLLIGAILGLYDWVFKQVMGALI